MANLSYPEISEITTAGLPPASIDALKTLRNQQCESTAKQTGFKLQPQQKFLRRILSPENPTRNLLLVHGTGTGKCHGIDTPILMYDGSIKLVQDVREGDMLMGDDSTPRQVLSLARGRDELYSITSVKGETYTGNSEHILCLQHTSNKSDVTEIPIKDYLQLSKKLQRNLKGYRTAIEFAEKPVPIDPYILGVWLGDGSKRDPVISSQDAVILKYVRDFCVKNNSILTFQSKYDYRITSISKKYSNVFLEFLKSYNLLNNKHVPLDYKANSREVRLQVLAGLIDTDGYLTKNTYEITQKEKQLSDDVVFLARSLGFCATTTLVEKACIYNGERRPGMYYRTHISGDTNEIPVKILRKHASQRKQIKNPLRYGITVSSLGEGDYYGFTLDGNNRYVLGDFTVTHNTCTSIQVAEEYILRPEFQDKRVMVVASATVQDNFRNELFQMKRVKIDEIAGTLESKQCTGRRYLDMLLRIESEPANWNNPRIRDKLERTADRIIDEFYEFMAYESFGTYIEKRLGGTEKDIDRDWVHKNFDNRLIIVDEAHNVPEGKEGRGVKGITRSLENLVKTADGLVLVFLTATPMFDTYDELAFYMNLFLWNDRKQDFKTSVKMSDYFNGDATLKAGQPGETFRTWCQNYVSYVKGENPFTFPFRLPAPKAVSYEEMITSWLGKPIPPADQIKYLALTESIAQGIQKDILSRTVSAEDEEGKKTALMEPTICVLPGAKTFNEVFTRVGKQYEYIGEPFLTPETIASHAAKFVTVMKSIESGKGVCLVYSNYVTMGARLFAMALEEHGYTPASGNSVLVKSRYEGSPKGKYIVLTSDISDAEIDRLISLARSDSNSEGQQVRVIVSSKIVSEGVDFRFVRQVHILDPWWNMSRIEQVAGRGLRNCSHQVLPFDDQNCTVYFHVARTGDGKECFDEYTYRTKVEQKAMKIARVRKVMAESAIDCPILVTVNNLPEDWKKLEVPQRQSEGGKMVTYRLGAMLAPTFNDAPDVAACVTKPLPDDPEHVRPLSTYLDVRDEILVKLADLFLNKPIWDREQLFIALRPYTKEVVLFNLQQAITSGYRFKDSFGRPAILESKGDLYALAPLGVPNSTMIERISQPPVRGRIDLPDVTPKEVAVAETVAPDILDTKREAFKFPADARERFSTEVLNGFIFDHDFTEAERRAYIRTRPNTLPFASRLYVEGSDIIVLGKDTFEPPEMPIGEDLTAYRAWNAVLLKRFIDNKDKLFASLKNGKLTISKMTIEGDSVRRKFEKGSKKFEPIVCDTGENNTATMNVFAKYIDKKGIGLPKVSSAPGKPLKDMTGPSRCMYIELLCREQNNCVWVTPEELSVLYETKENKDAFTKEFKS